MSSFSHPILSLIQAPSLDLLLDALHSQEARKTIAVTGLPDGQAAFIASLLAERTGRKVLLVHSNDLKAIRASDDLNQLLKVPTAFLPGGEIDLTRGVSSQENEWRRLEALHRLTWKDVRVLTTSMDALMQRMGDPARFREGTVSLMCEDRYKPADLISHLVRMGYERVELVEGKGQCCLRGSVLDVYPPESANAYRIEFFDDIVDSIRSFEPMTQRSLDRMHECILPPASEILPDPEDAPAAARRMRSVIGTLENTMVQDDSASSLLDSLPPLPDDDDELPSFFDEAVAPKLRERSWSATRESELERRKAALLDEATELEQGLPFRRIRAWSSVVLPRAFTVTDWFDAEIVLLCEPESLRARARERTAGFAEDLTNAMERGEAVQAQSNLLLTWEDIAASLEHRQRVVLSDLGTGLAENGFAPDTTVRMELVKLTNYQSQFRTLAADVRKWVANGLRVILLSGGTARGMRMQSSLSEMNVSCRYSESGDVLKESVTIIPLSLVAGFLFQEAGIVVVSDTDIYGASFHRASSHTKAGEKIASFTELNPGDYVVHVDHGVGIFMGCIQMTSDGARHDYLLIQYNGRDKLYVPVEQFSRVQRYIGNPNTPPKLNSIGGRDWAKQKNKVKEGLRQMAFSLAKLYAKRSSETGYAFPPDTSWQNQFNDQFPYELTADQAQSIEEIKADMESHRNMDRLLCGDVGYGKTEVSLRAAFKAIMDNRQVAMLAPTTILVQQHYNTIVKRFAGFPVKVEYLSRFRTPKEVHQILEDLQRGKIDFIVGTHRLLGKDVKFKNLGLLIVDEEQRFGVTHKEAIKNIKSQVDVLTLSATPIPRTLHMSMVGIRDMSVLSSPPADRLPVQTHVVEYSDILIRDVILREISRGGQVYFLYNRVQSIEAFYERVHALVPEARIGLAHGQMKTSGLEDVMMDFYRGSYDVLLCTTIIESGLDVPTANTLIVFDSERFGLSQLYQLRGRVGRSNRQAFAYFTYRPNHILSEAAQKRLSAIREFTEFGSGFRIAMRDLEIRGAGNILGPEQHGHLETIGYEMYCRLIEEAMREVQGETITSELETRVDFRVNAYLPNTYITDEHQRMEMYRRIAALSSDEDREDIIDELIDRFGDMPEVVNTLLDVSHLRYLCNHEGISQVSHHGENIVFRLNRDYVKDPAMLQQAMRDTDSRLKLVDRPQDAIVVKVGPMYDSEVLKQALQIMRVLSNRMGELREEAALTEKPAEATLA